MGKKKLLKKLRQAASKLPPASRAALILKSGKEILEQNPLAKDKDGNEISASKTYMVKAPMPVNHYRAMKKLNSQYGIEHAAGYFKGVMDAKQRQLTK